MQPGARHALFGGAIGPAIATFITEASSSVDSNTYTFAGQSFGPAYSTRIILVAIASRHGGGADISGVTIGGIAATQVGSWSVSTATLLEFWAAAVPTGTTGSVVVNFTATSDRCGIAIWALDNIESLTPRDEDASVVSSTVNTATLDAVVDGIMICTTYITDGSLSCVFTGTAGLTERWDTTIESQEWAGASGSPTAGANKTVIATWSGSNNIYIHAISLR